MKKQQAISIPTHFLPATFKTPTRQIWFPFLLMVVLSSFYACQKDLEGPDPCSSGQNNWNVNLTVQDSPPSSFDNAVLLFRSGEPIDIKLTLSPSERNTCPEQHSVEVQLIQATSRYNSLPPQVVATLWSSVVNAPDSFLLHERFMPPAGSGTYAFLATLRDAEGKIVRKITSKFFHVQQVVSEERPNMIGIYSPYHGQEIKKGDLIPYDLYFGFISGFCFEGKVEIFDENNQLIDVIKEDGALPTTMWGQHILNKPGKYIFKASVWSCSPSSTGELSFYSMAFNEFTIKD
ncbi:MAG: hypothetical protein HUU01_17020 [Saprospiraceae bacterium]|nr:hypothetical protein [Saprospiraceae bacterium]